MMNTERLRLRPLKLEDAPQYYDMLNYPNNTEFLAPEDLPHSVDDAVKEIEYWKGLFTRRESIFWGITLKHDDVLIGCIGFNNMHFMNKRAEISYDLHHHYWRQGLMTEAATEVLNFTFNELGFCRIEARTMPQNMQSQAMLKKMKFLYEGMQRGYRVSAGKPLDVMLYAILVDEWNKH
jgi:ribosomal-protein-alanine N-acetyltransferase